jgi:hypothetical protein
MTFGGCSVIDAGRLRTQVSTAQMARHCGHQRNRLPRCIVMSTSTGEQPHSGHGTATSSGLCIRMFPKVRKKRPARLEEPSRSSGTRGGVGRDAPAGIGTRAPRNTTEHLGCQRGHVHTLAGMRNVEHQWDEKAELSLPRAAIPQTPAWSSLPGDCANGACFTMEVLAW